VRAERLLQTPAVVEPFEELHDGLPGHRLITELPMPHQFVLQPTEEVLHKGAALLLEEFERVGQNAAL